LAEERTSWGKKHFEKRQSARAMTPGKTPHQSGASPEKGKGRVVTSLARRVRGIEKLKCLLPGQVVGKYQGKMTHHIPDKKAGEEEKKAADVAQKKKSKDSREVMRASPPGRGKSSSQS